MKPEQKRERYQRIYDQLKKLLQPHNNRISAMSTTAAILHHKFDYFFWTGFYLLADEDLMVGPYQGSVACIRLKKDTGVCHAAIKAEKTIIVGNVHDFPGHIACDSRSSSEIVIPVKNGWNEIVGALDVDSRDFNAFDEIDQDGLERIVQLLK